MRPTIADPVRQGNRLQRAFLNALCRHMRWDYYWFRATDGRIRLFVGDDDSHHRWIL